MLFGCHSTRERSEKQMDSKESEVGSERLKTLIRRLRLYNPPPNQQDQIPKASTELVSRELNSAAESAAISTTHQTQTPNRAAVLICLFEGDEGDMRVILTKRSSNLSSHSGEVALPGGKREESDADDVETALREAKEEIGMDAALVNVVTVLEPFVTKRGMAVVPVIGILSDKKSFSPTPNAAEVEAIFNAPLEMFLKDENRRAEEREWKGEKYLLHFFDYEAENKKKHVIWALTAGILIKVASIVYQQQPAFLDRRPKFWNGTAGLSCSWPKL